MHQNEKRGSFLFLGEKQLLHIFLTYFLKIFCKNPLTLYANRTIFILLALDMIEC